VVRGGRCVACSQREGGDDIPKAVAVPKPEVIYQWCLFQSVRSTGLLLLGRVPHLCVCFHTVLTLHELIAVENRRVHGGIITH
jgi:hypothetical protein